MDAIEGSVAALKVMADATVRIAIDIEPRDAQAAFRMFGTPGTAIAIAVLKTEQDQPESES